MDTATLRGTIAEHRILNHEAAHIAALALLGLLARVAVAPWVAVNGDTGLYLYDAMQLLQGQTIVVDFPSRSPLMEWFLAGLIALPTGQPPLVNARAGMIAVSILLGLAIYALARELFGHRVGLAAAGLFYLTPFAVVWGVWVKTEEVATLVALVGIIAAVRHIDRPDMPHWAMVAAGAMFGAAFLIRRSVIVVAGAFGLFFLWYRYRNGHRHVQTVTLAASTALAAIGTTALAYLLLAAEGGGGLAMAYEIADVHGLALLKSDGQGSLAWLETPRATTAYAEDRPGLIWDLCQKCGANTGNTFAHTFFVTLPAALLALVPLRAALRRFDRLTAETLAPAVLAGPLLYYAGMNLHTAEAVGVFIAAVGVGVVWATQPIDWTAYWRPTLALPVGTFLLLAAAYLYRDRILYVTYFQDLFPFLVIIAAVGLVAWLRTNDAPTARVGLALLLVSSGLAAGAHAYPLTDATDNRTHWFTMDAVDAYGEDIDERTDPGDRVFTAQSLYVVHSDARPLADLSRRYYVFRMWPDSEQTRELTQRIVAALESGRVTYAIDDVNMQEITSVSPPIRNALADHYCEVDDPLYDKTNATLLKHESEGCTQ